MYMDARREGRKEGGLGGWLIRLGIYFANIMSKQGPGIRSITYIIHARAYPIRI